MTSLVSMTCGLRAMDCWKDGKGEVLYLDGSNLPFMIHFPPAFTAALSALVPILLVY